MFRARGAQRRRDGKVVVGTQHDNNGKIVHTPDGQCRGEATAEDATLETEEGVNENDKPQQV